MLTRLKYFFSWLVIGLILLKIFSTWHLFINYLNHNIWDTSFPSQYKSLSISCVDFSYTVFISCTYEKSDPEFVYMLQNEHPILFSNLGFENGWIELFSNHKSQCRHSLMQWNIRWNYSDNNWHYLTVRWTQLWMEDLIWFVLKQHPRNWKQIDIPIYLNQPRFDLGRWHIWQEYVDLSHSHPHNRLVDNALNVSYTIQYHVCHSGRMCSHVRILAQISFLNQQSL